MFPTPKNTSSVPNPFGRLAKPQIYDLASNTFGSIMVSVSKGEYRYGFNGKETDNETGLQDYGFRIYNPSYGKFLSVDPLASDYPYFTPYQFASNSVIWNIDIDGLEGTPSTIGSQKRTLNNAPPSPGGAPHIVYEYKRENDVLYRRNHYKNVDPNSRGFKRLQDPNRNNWLVVTENKSRGNILWSSLAGHDWQSRPIITTINHEVINNQLSSANYQSNASPTVNPAVTLLDNVVGVINAEIQIANTRTSFLNNTLTSRPNIKIGEPVFGGKEAPGRNNSSTTTTITQITEVTTAVNVNFSLTLFVQVNNQFFQNTASQIQARSGVSVNIIANSSFIGGTSPNGLAFNPATDFEFQINYLQQVTTTQTHTQTQVTSSNYTPPNSTAQPGNP